MNEQKRAAIEQAAKLQIELDKLKKIIDEPETPTYADVVEKLRPKCIYSTDGTIGWSPVDTHAFATREIAEREAIRAKWLNICKYVNGEEKGRYCIGFKNIGRPYVMEFEGCYPGLVLFKSKEAAMLAVQILGEDEFRKM